MNRAISQVNSQPDQSSNSSATNTYPDTLIIITYYTGSKMKAAKLLLG